LFHLKILYQYLVCGGELVKNLFCFGDSHVSVFNYIDDQKVLKNTKIFVTMVPGATALGMVNPNSKTNALNIFYSNLVDIPKDSSLLFMLGEVDCGFVIWYRAQKYGIDVKEQLFQSINNYFSFLKVVEDLGYKNNNIIVCTPPPPTIKDNQKWGEVANLRREVKATQKERTELTLYYNEIIRSLCQQRGYKIIDTEKEFIDPKTSLVRAQYLNKNPLDHHLDNESASTVYIRKLKMLGFN
jgi:hypothetical protein